MMYARSICSAAMAPRDITDARYLYKAGRHSLAGPTNGAAKPLSDHAALSIRITLPDTPRVL